jgi:hypothetical protein
MCIDTQQDPACLLSSYSIQLSVLKICPEILIALFSPEFHLISSTQGIFQASLVPALCTGAWKFSKKEAEVVREPSSLAPVSQESLLCCLMFIFLQNGFKSVFLQFHLIYFSIS